MKIGTETVMTLTLSMEDYDALVHVDELLKKVQDSFDENQYLMSVDSGELVHINELGRVRGIIGAFSQHRAWYIRERYKKGD